MGSLDDFQEIYDDDQTEDVKEEKKRTINFIEILAIELAGVHSGIAEYFKIDPIIVRILFSAVPLN